VSTHVWLAGVHEAETVSRLLTQFRDWYGRDWPSDNAFLAGVERLLERTDTEFLLGAPDEDTPPMGVCQLRYRWGLWYAAEDCWLEDLFVADEARGRGLGEALVTAAVERAQARRCRRMELDVSDQNENAWRLYERLGFSADYKPPGRNVVMGLKLEDPGAG
jgi:ribosomal protein S18 acetylase RimI-like enzyme